MGHHTPKRGYAFVVVLLTTIYVASGETWDLAKLQSESKNSASKCYVALFEESCGSSGGVYKISEDWYTGHFGGPFADFRNGAGTCGNIVEKWPGKSGSHADYVSNLADKSSFSDGRATYHMDFECGADPCADVTCLNGGTCTTGTCDCVGLFEGANCGTEIPSEVVKAVTDSTLPGDGGVTYSQKPIGTDAIEVSITVAGTNWIAFGIAQSAGSMTSGGKGTDAAICAAGVVSRMWMTAKSKPAFRATTGLDSSSCTQAGGSTTLTFTRKLTQTGDAQSVAMTPGVEQPLMWAKGNGEYAFSKIHGEKSMFALDFAKGAATVTKKKGEGTLYAHMTFMILSWGFMLPFGVTFSLRLRNVKTDTSAPNAWFKLHESFQYLGWLLQIIGFVMAAVHVANNGVHFAHTHTLLGLAVVILGTLQPLNAVLRPHAAPAGEAKPTKRLVWEIVHKGSGYTAVILGIVTILLGIVLVSDLGYDSSVVTFSVVMVVLFTGSVFAYFITSFVCQKWSEFWVNLIKKKE